MNILKKAAGKILYGIAKLLSVVLDVFIKVVEAIVTVLGNVTKGLIAFIGMGGCLLLFIFSVPWSFTFNESFSSFCYFIFCYISIIGNQVCILFKIYKVYCDRVFI